MGVLEDLLKQLEEQALRNTKPAQGPLNVTVAKPQQNLSVAKVQTPVLVKQGFVGPIQPVKSNLGAPVPSLQGNNKATAAITPAVPAQVYTPNTSPQYKSLQDLVVSGVNGVKPPEYIPPVKPQSTLSKIFSDNGPLGAFWKATDKKTEANAATSKIGGDIIQGAFRGGGSAGLSITDLASGHPGSGPSISIDPEDPVWLNTIKGTFFGDEPVKDIATRMAESELKVEDFKKTNFAAKYGLDTLDSKNVSILGIGALTLADFTGTGDGSTKLVSELAKVKDVGTVAKILKQLKVADEIIPGVAEEFAKMTDKKAITEALTKIKEAADLTSQAKKGTFSAVEDLSQNATNSLQNSTLGQKAGSIERATADIQKGDIYPIRTRVLEDGTTFIEDGRHRLEAARNLGMNDFPVEDVTSKYARMAADTTPEVASATKTAAEVAGDFVVPEAKKSESFIKKWVKDLSPMKYTEESAQDAYKTLVRDNLLARESANAESKVLKDIPESEGWQAILDYTKGKASKYGDAIQNTFDRLYQTAKDAGLDVPFRKNYVTQLYSNSVQEVKTAMANFLKDQGVDKNLIQSYLDGAKDLPEDVAKRLKLSPDFTKARVFPDYETAMQYGLKPKYTQPAQIAAHYVEELQKSVANNKFIDTLVSKGQLSTVQKTGWELIPNLPTKGKELFYGPQDLANALNGIYRNEGNLSSSEAFFKFTANVSKKAQEVALSGGIPATNVNFFSMGQLIKELTAGNYKSIPAFVRSNFNSTSIKWFEKNTPVIRQMAEEGLDMSGRIGQYQDMFETLAHDKNIYAKTKRIFGEGWNKLFSEKTFASFMPQMQIQQFKDVFEKGLADGMEKAAAQKLAGEVTRNMFGIIEDMGRSKSTEDVLSSIFFAPKFRQSVVSTLFNTIKSGTTQLANPAFYRNRRLITGMALSFGMYDALNYKLNGHHMWNNPDGKRFSLMIPRDNGRIVYVEFMPSFLSFARNMTGGTIALAGGDVKEAKRQYGSLFSMPVKLTSELWANEDYFGRPIYKDTDSTVKKTLKIAQHFGLGVAHPYIKEVVKQIESHVTADKEDDTPINESVSMAMELPLKFTTKDAVARAQYYKAVDAKTIEHAKAREKVQPIFDKVQKAVNDDNLDEADRLVAGMSDADYEVYKDLLASDKRGDTAKGKANSYDTYLEVQRLVNEGKDGDAEALINGLSDDEYKSYALVLKQFQN